MSIHDIAHRQIRNLANLRQQGFRRLHIYKSIDYCNGIASNNETGIAACPAVVAADRRIDAFADLLDREVGRICTESTEGKERDREQSKCMSVSHDGDGNMREVGGRSALIHGEGWHIALLRLGPCP